MNIEDVRQVVQEELAKVREVPVTVRGEGMTVNAAYTRLPANGEFIDVRRPNGKYRDARVTRVDQSTAPFEDGESRALLDVEWVTA